MIVDMKQFAVFPTVTLCDTPELRILLLVHEGRGEFSKHVITLHAAEVLRDQLDVAIRSVTEKKNDR